MKKEKSTVIGHLAAQTAAYELHKSKKDLNSETAPCFDIVITSEFHHSIYYQLLEICKVMNQQPKLTKLFLNSTNQFSNCMNYCGIKNEVEINANWIIQQSQ